MEKHLLRELFHNGQTKRSVDIMGHCCFMLKLKEFSCNEGKRKNLKGYSLNILKPYLQIHTHTYIHTYICIHKWKLLTLCNWVS